MPGAQYTISYSIDVAPGSNGLPVSGSIPFTAPDSGTFADTVTGSFPALAGSFTFSGTATLIAGSPKNETSSTININFSPSTLTCGPPPPRPCSAPVDQRLELYWHSYQWRQLCLVQCQLYCDRTTQQWSDSDPDEFNDFVYGRRNSTSIGSSQRAAPPHSTR
jgi:hypothetical protein